MTESIARWACPCGYASTHALRVDGPLQCPRCDRPLDRQATVGQASVRDGEPGDLADRIDELWHRLSRDERGQILWWLLAWLFSMAVLVLVGGSLMVVIHA